MSKSLFLSCYFIIESFLKILSLELQIIQSLFQDVLAHNFFISANPSLYYDALVCSMLPLSVITWIAIAFESFGESESSFIKD